MKAIVIVFCFLTLAVFGTETSERPQFPHAVTGFEKLQASHLPTIENDPGSIIAGCVNAITGNYFEQNNDAITHGPVPITLHRAYLSDRLPPRIIYEHRLDENGKNRKKPQDSANWPNLHSWYLNFENIATLEYNALTVQDPGGGSCQYRQKDYSTLYPYDISNWKGLTNFSSGSISGQTNIKNARAILNSKSAFFDLQDADGTVRSYQLISNTLNAARYQVIKEKLPPGQWILHEPLHGRPHRKYAVNATQSKVFSWLKYENNGSQLIATNSDGKMITYDHYPENRHTSTLLKSITQSDGSKTSLEYQFSQLVAKHLPNGQSIRIEYDNEMRVKTILKPIGQDEKLYPAYTFAYYSTFTEVFDAIGNKIRFHFNGRKQLVAKEYFVHGGRYALERNYYGNDLGKDATNIICKSLEDAHGRLWFCRTFVYDNRGNILFDRLHGNLTGLCTVPLQLNDNGEVCGGEMCEKSYKYFDNDAFNLIAEENDGKALIKYKYLPSTNLLTEKYIFDLASNRLSLREFREYDQDLLLCKITIDDGSREGSHDGTDCSERHITYFKNKHEGNGIGQPEIIEKKYFDFGTGQERLLQRTHNIYGANNLVIEQLIYDADNQFAYSLKQQYDSMDRQIFANDPLGNSIKMEYDANGNLVRKIEQHKQTQYVYDFSNRLVYKNESGYGAENRYERYRYDLAGHCTAKEDQFGNEIRFVHDILGRVTETIFPACQSELDTPEQACLRKTYDIAGNVTCLIDPCNHIKTFQYNSRNQPTLIQEDQATELYQYDLYGRLLKKTEKNGVTTYFKYDFLDRITHSEKYASTGQLLSQISTSYNAFHLLNHIDAAGHITFFDYDAAGREKSVEKLLDNGTKTKIVKEYDALGNIGTLKEWFGPEDADYIKHCKKYDLTGHVLEEMTCDANETIHVKSSYQYDSRGNRTHTITYPEDSTGAITVIRYDHFDRPIEKIDPFGNRKYIHYDEAFINEIGQKVLQTKETDELGIVTITTHDTCGRAVSIIRKSNFGQDLQAKKLCYDPLDKVISEKTTLFQPCEKSSFVTHWFRYGAYHHLESIVEEATSANPRKTRFLYNNIGEMIGKETSDIHIEYCYDALGRMTRQKATPLKASLEAVDYHYTYNASDQVIQLMNLNTQKSTYRTYDTCGNVTEEIQENGLKIHYQYDLLGRKTAIRLPNESTIRYSYYGPFLQQIAYDNICYRYLARDLSGAITSAQAVGNSGNIDYRCDLMGRPCSIKSRYWQESIPHEGYDAAGNICCLNVVDPQGHYRAQYRYSDNYQVISEEGPFSHQFSYDSLHNRISKDDKKYTLGSFNQLLHDGNKGYQWDQSGNLTATLDSHYSYDALNQLIGFDKEQATTTYTYDGLYRRMSKKNNHQTLHYLYDGQNEIGAFNTHGELVELRLLGEGLGAEIGATVAMQLDNTLYGVINDHRGNIVCLLDSNSGLPVETYRYSAYGEENVANRSISPWRFSSKRYDPESKLIYFGRRYYNPDIGRFITTDPLGFHDGPNLYAFVHNNPLTHHDLYGLRDSEGARGDRGGKSFFSSLRDRLSSCLSFLGSTVEWIGKNLVPVPGIRDAVEAIGRFTRGGKLCQKADYHSYHSAIVHIPGKVVDGPKLTYINGIWTTPLEFIQHCEALSAEHKGAEVWGVYNSSKGLITDLISCILARIGVITYTEKKIVEFINKHTNRENNGIALYVHAHSQGVMHFQNASRYFTDNQCKQIIIDAYGGGSIIEEGRFATVKNFISENDYIPISDALRYVKARLTNSDKSIIFLKRSYNNPIKEHSFLNNTYHSKMAENAIEFTRTYQFL